MKLLGYVIISLGFFVSVANAAGSVDHGKELSQKCVMCHGASGEGNPSMKAPKISGMAVGDFTKAIKEYKDGTRSGMMMQMSVKKLSEQDVADLAEYYSSL